VQAVGGMALSVDGEPVDVAETFAYKGMMLSGVPNFTFVFGYTNASWTLKVGLVGEHFARLLAYLDTRGYDAVTPTPADPGMTAGPLVKFDPGYLKRAFGQLPRQGSRPPWRTSPDYGADVKLLRRGPVDGPELRFSCVARSKPSR
jgi:monooxygenase